MATAKGSAAKSGATRNDKLRTGLEPKQLVEHPYTTIRFEKDPQKPIARITLNRPHQHNAVNFQMMDEIGDALEQVRFDNDIKVVILQAEGDNFSSGHDMKELAMVHQPGKKLGIAERINRDRRRTGDSWEPIMRFNKPIICKIHGKAIGAGLQFALVADIAIAADNAEITMSPCRFGGPVQDVLLPLWILSVGLKQAEFMLFTGASVTGKRAAKMGLVTKSVPLKKLDETVEKAAEAVCLLPLDGLVLSREWINFQLAIFGVIPGLIPGYMGHAFFSNIRYRDNEFNFLQNVKNQGMAEAFRLRDKRFEQLLGDWFDD